MVNKNKRWFETLPGILTGIAAVIGAIASLYVAMDGKQGIHSASNVGQHTSETSKSVLSTKDKQPNMPQSQKLSPSPINLSSTWHELYPNPGNVSETIHDKDMFKFTIQGTIQGLYSTGPKGVERLKGNISRVRINRLFLLQDNAQAPCLLTE